MLKHYEKGIFAAALLAGLASVGWYAGVRPVSAFMNNAATVAMPAGAAYPVKNRNLTESIGPRWSHATAQSEGSEWVYEIFTPPTIYYHESAGVFVVNPAQDQDSRGKPLPGLELLAVRREPFRLQLMGYLGAPGDYQAVFVSSKFPDTVLAREEHRFDELGLTLKRFGVRKVPVASEDMPPAFDITAVAMLFDETTGTDVMLDSRERKFTTTPIAVLKMTDSIPGTGELREGDLFTHGGANYRMERIQLAPVEVVVARVTPGMTSSETYLLRQSGPNVDRSGPDQPTIARIAPGVATTNR